MIHLGAVNIDTSHPLGFAEALEKTKRARYSAVYNDSFRGEEEVDGFIRRFGLDKKCASLAELAGACDIGMIHGCNWDEHLRYAQPFWDAGKPVFMDKPAVGSEADCRKLLELSRKHTLLGASAARYAYEIQEFMAKPEDELGPIVFMSVTSGVDEFNYGIHAVEIIGGVLGRGVRRVRWAGRGAGGGKTAHSYLVEFENGASAVYTTVEGVWQPFVVTVVTSKTTWTCQLDSSRLYAALLDEICNYMEGKPHRLAGPEALVESVRIMLAGKASKEAGGGAVALSSLEPARPGFDGAAFFKEYSAAAGRMYH